MRVSWNGILYSLSLVFFATQVSAKTFKEKFEGATHRVQLSNIDRDSQIYEADDLPFFTSVGESESTIHDCDKVINTIVEEVFGFENEDIYFGIMIWCGNDGSKTDFGYQGYFYGNTLESTKQAQKFISENEGKEYFGHKFHYSEGLAIIASIKFDHPTEAWEEDPPEEGQFPITERKAFKSMHAYTKFNEDIYAVLFSESFVKDYLKFVGQRYGEFYKEHLEKTVLPAATGISYTEEFEILTSEHELFGSGGIMTTTINCQNTATGFCL